MACSEHILVLCSKVNHEFVTNLLEELCIPIHAWNEITQWDLNSIMECHDWNKFRTFIVLPDIYMLMNDTPTTSQICEDNLCKVKLHWGSCAKDFQEVLNTFFENFKAFKKEVIENVDDKSCQVILFPLLPTKVIHIQDLDEIHLKAHTLSPLPFILKEDSFDEEFCETFQQNLIKFDQTALEHADSLTREKLQVYVNLGNAPVEFIRKLTIGEFSTFEISSDFYQLSYWNMMANYYLPELFCYDHTKMDEAVNCSRVVVVCDKKYFPYLPSEHSNFYSTSSLTFIDFNISMKETWSLEQVISHVENISESALWLFIMDQELFKPHSAIAKDCETSRCLNSIQTYIVPDESMENIKCSLSKHVKMTMSMLLRLQQFYGGFPITLPVWQYIASTNMSCHKEMHQRIIGKPLLIGKPEVWKPYFNSWKEVLTDQIKKTYEEETSATLLKNVKNDVCIVSPSLNTSNTECMAEFLLRNIKYFHCLFKANKILDICNDLQHLKEVHRKYSKLSRIQRERFIKEYTNWEESFNFNFKLYELQPTFHEKYEEELLEFIKTHGDLSLPILEKRWKSHWAHFLQSIRYISKQKKLLTLLEEPKTNADNKQIISPDNVNDMENNTDFSVHKKVFNTMPSYEMFVKEIDLLLSSGKLVKEIQELKSLGYYSYEGIRFLHKHPNLLKLAHQNIKPHNKQCNIVLKMLQTTSEILDNEHELQIKAIVEATMDKSDSFLSNVIKNVLNKSNLSLYIKAVRVLQFLTIKARQC